MKVYYLSILRGHQLKALDQNKQAWYVKLICILLRSKKWDTQIRIRIQNVQNTMQTPSCSFVMRMVKHWNCLPRQAVKSPSLGIF